MLDRRAGRVAALVVFLIAWAAAAVLLWRTTVPSLDLGGFDEHRFFSARELSRAHDYEQGLHVIWLLVARRRPRHARRAHAHPAALGARDRARACRDGGDRRDGHPRRRLGRVAAVRHRRALVAAPLGPGAVRHRRVALRAARSGSRANAVFAMATIVLLVALARALPAHLVDPGRGRVRRARAAALVRLRLARRGGHGPRSTTRRCARTSRQHRAGARA